MDEERREYIEEFGLLFGQFGLSRMLGRVLGVLMISDPPERSAEELAEALGASRGSISQTTRSLIQMGLVQRWSRPGERRDYFRIKPGAWHEIMRREMEALGISARRPSVDSSFWTPMIPTQDVAWKKCATSILTGKERCQPSSNGGRRSRKAEARMALDSIIRQS